MGVVGLLLASMTVGSMDRAVIDVASFGAKPDSGEDATPAFQRAIAAVRAHGGPTTLRIPPGRYDFFSTHATRRPCYYSNATEPGSDAVRTIAIDLVDLKDLTIEGPREGPGARLVMRGEMTMLVAERCAGLRLQGLEFDFARPTVSEVLAEERGDGYWIGRVHRDSAYRIEAGRIVWFGEDWNHGHNLVQHHDPVQRKVWRGADPTAGATAIRDLDDRRLRFDVPPDALAQVVVGRTYQFRDTARTETGMWFHRSRDVAMRDVKVRAMAGFGVLFQYTQNVDLDRVVFAPTPESGRTTVSAGDILHFSGCRGRIRVRNSTLTASHDDAINVHGTHLKIVERLDDNRLRMRFGHPQTWGFAAFAPGDEVDYVRRETLIPYATARVRALATTDDPHEQIVTLDRPVPAGIAFGSDVLENATWTPSVEVTNCDVALVPTRGFLLTTRRPVRIVGNRFHRTPMHAILVEDDASGWFESGFVRDLLIRDNAFFECADETIRMNPENSIDGGPVHRNVRIERNRFTLIGPTAVHAKATTGLRVTGNRFITATETNAAEFVKTTGSSDVRVNGNVVGR